MVCKLQTYMTATGLDEEGVADGRKRAVLLHCLGVEGQRIFHSLGDCPTYKDAVDKIESHFGPRKSIIVQRHRFRQRGQRPGESTASYVATLKELVAQCNFGSLADEMVRDQLIEKTNSTRVRERLLMEPDTLTLEKAVTLAEQIESALADSHVIGIDSTPSIKPIKVKQEPETKVQGVYKGQYNRGNSRRKTREKWSANGDSSDRATQSKNVVCGNCGADSHITRHPTCPARGKKCSKCHKVGHFGRVCRSSATRRVRQIDTLDEPTQETYVYTVSGSTPADSKFKSCATTINGVSLSLMIDLGAKVSIMNEKLYQQHFRHVPLTATNQVLTSYTGDTIPVIGIAKLTVQYEEQRVDNFPFYITRQGSNLMGINLFNALGFQISRHGIPVNSIGSKVKDKFPQLFTGLGKISSSVLDKV
ncbi:uncharacterized protein [Ptychodera flava]|uniref:uncharacterized protein n=1 Tax=Ptychodera flava TaxID=63121 RepID=UPI00396A6D3A